MKEEIKKADIPPNPVTKHQQWKEKSKNRDKRKKYLNQPKWNENFSVNSLRNSIKVACQKINKDIERKNPGNNKKKSSLVPLTHLKAKYGVASKTPSKNEKPKSIPLVNFSLKNSMKNSALKTSRFPR